MRVMDSEATATGWKLRILGYRSMGLRVPEVMTTDWNLLKMGFMAREASRQASWMTGSGICGQTGSKYLRECFVKACLHSQVNSLKTAHNMIEKPSSCSQVAKRSVHRFGPPREAQLLVGGAQAGEVPGPLYLRQSLVVRLRDDREALCIGSHQGAKVRHQLDGCVLIGVYDLKGLQ